MRKGLFLAAALAAMVPSAASAYESCLREDQIYNWHALNDRTLIVENEIHQKFKLSLIGTCQNLSYYQRLGFKAVGGLGISCLTPGDMVISHDFATGPQHCAITRITPYSRDEEAADRANAASHGHGYGY